MSRQLEFLDNLIRVNRFSGNLLVKSESVSDHVWCMNALAFEFVPKMNDLYKTDYDLKYIIYAIALHDLDESLYCDLPRKFKYHNSELKEQISKTVELIMEESLPVDLIRDIHIAENRKTETGLITKIFDIAQAGYKMIQEIQLGNSYFIDELPGVVDCLAGNIDEVKLLSGLDRSCNQKYKLAITWLAKQFIEEFESFIESLNK